MEVLVEVDGRDQAGHLSPDIEFVNGSVLCLHVKFLNEPQLEASMGNLSCLCTTWKSVENHSHISVDLFTE